MAEDAPAPGLFASLRRVFATLVQAVSLRVELASVELDEQIAYARNLLLWYIVAIIGATLTVLFFAIAIIIACWDTHRLLAVCSVTAAFALVGLVGAGFVRTRLNQRPLFLAATIDELKRDAAALRPDE
jgi:uncharacterized membrane protein YqjE